MDAMLQPILVLVVIIPDEVGDPTEEFFAIHMYIINIYNSGQDIADYARNDDIPGTGNWRQKVTTSLLSLSSADSSSFDLIERSMNSTS